MSAHEAPRAQALSQRLVEAEAIIEALLSGQIDAVVDPRSHTPVLLSKAQGALKESEERFRRIVETANEGIAALGPDFRFTFVNQRFAEMLGYPGDELLGMPLLAILPEADAAKTALRIDRQRHGLSEESEVAYRRKDGSELWALIKSSPIRGPDGAWAGTLGMMTDRTHHRQAEQDLRKSEEQYRQIVEATSDGIIKLDDKALIVFVNRRFAEMLGYEPHEMVGSNALAFMSPAAQVIAREAYQKRRQGVQVTDTSFRHRNGTDVWVNVAGSPLFDGDGEFVGNLGVVRDVTEQRRLQSQLMVSDRMASVGTLAAGVAHEINNPLAAVIANLDYIAEHLGSLAKGEGIAVPLNPPRTAAWCLEEMTAPLADAREAAHKVRLIVRDLRIFSRSPTDERTGSVDVKAIMETSIRIAWNEIRHRARLVKLYSHVPCVEANEARLGQVFLNLMVNAAQALPEGRAEHNEITVSTRLDGDRVAIEVSDTGPGIPPETIGRIFDAFFTTKPVGVGTGLGLAICQRIVTDLGGELTVRSELGRGTTFRVALPVAQNREVEIVPQPAAPAIGRRGRILVVDDEESVLRIVSRILSKEHEVVTTCAARKALALCTGGETFDLILCDMMMPDMTGMDLHRELLRLAPEQADRMIFLTGGAFTERGRRFLTEIPKEHIEKPFDSANLRAIVRRYLR